MFGHYGSSGFLSDSGLLLNDKRPLFSFLTVRRIAIVQTMSQFIGSEEQNTEEEETDANIAEVERQPVVHRLVEVGADS